MIHWRYIKGMSEDTDGSSPLYTFLTFQHKIDDTSLSDFKFVPMLECNTENILPSDNNEAIWGHIITQQAINQHIDASFAFWNDVDFTHNDEDTTPHVVNFYNSAHFYSNVQIHDNWLNFSDGGSNTDCCFNSINDKPFHFLFNAADSGVSIYNNGCCEAIYFNAKSDKRAKTNIEPLSINALDLIKRVQLYSFKYKDSDLPSIGIIAQDIKDVDIAGFKLVDNEQASGLDMDYMSIHESKLIYILWKAIQEQQKEIEELKSKLK